MRKRVFAHAPTFEPKIFLKKGKEKREEIPCFSHTFSPFRPPPHSFVSLFLPLCRCLSVLSRTPYPKADRHWTLRSSCLSKITQMAMLKDGKCVDLVRLLKAFTAFVKSMLPNLEQKIVRTNQSSSYFKPLAFLHNDREYDAVLGAPLIAVILFYTAVFREHSLFKYTAAFRQLGEIAFEEGGLADITLSILMAFRQGSSDVHAKNAGHVVQYASAALQMMSCGDSVAEARSAFVQRAGDDLMHTLYWVLSKGPLIPEKAAMLYDAHSRALMSIATMYGRNERQQHSSDVDGVLEQLVQTLLECAKGENVSSVSSITSLAYCCKELSINDNNLEAMVAAGIVDAAVIILTTNDVIQGSWIINARWDIIAARESVVDLLLMLALSEKTIDSVFANEACCVAVNHAKGDLEHRLSSQSRRTLNGILIQFEKWKASTSSGSRSNTPPPSPKRPQSAHIMMSYSWAQQPAVKRIREALRDRGYDVWIDLEQMQGGTVDAMSRAIDDASVILYGVSEHYKVSANCKLEANYAHAQGKVMIPLMLQADFKPNGWLGTFLGSRLWYGFFGTALETDDAFEGVMDQMSRELSRHATPTRTPPSSPLRPPSLSGSPLRLSPSRPSAGVSGGSLLGSPARPPASPVRPHAAISPTRPYKARSLSANPPSTPIRTLATARTSLNLAPKPDPWAILGLSRPTSTTAAVAATADATRHATFPLPTALPTQTPTPTPLPTPLPTPMPMSTSLGSARMPQMLPAAMVTSSLVTLPDAMQRISERVLVLEKEGTLVGVHEDGDVASWVHDTLADVAQLAALIDAVGTNNAVLSRQITRMFVNHNRQSPK